MVFVCLAITEEYLHFLTIRVRGGSEQREHDMSVTEIENEQSVPPKFYSPQEFADLLGGSRGWVYALMERDQLKTLKLGGRRIIPAGEVDRLTGMAGFGS
jgi:excisionase family DNA binding protein